MCEPGLHKRKHKHKPKEWKKLHSLCLRLCNSGSQIFLMLMFMLKLMSKCEPYW